LIITLAVTLRFIEVLAAERTESFAVRIMQRYHGNGDEQLFLDNGKGLDLFALIKFRIKLRPVEFMFSPGLHSACRRQLNAYVGIDPVGKGFQAAAAFEQRFSLYPACNMKQPRPDGLKLSTAVNAVDAVPWSNRSSLWTSSG
jgi:hypothetical protein